MAVESRDLWIMILCHVTERSSKERYREDGANFCLTLTVVMATATGTSVKGKSKRGQGSVRSSGPEGGRFVTVGITWPPRR